MKTDLSSSAGIARGFWEIEDECQSAFDRGGPYWHICTDGNKQEIVFATAQDFVAAMNALAIVLHESGVIMIAFIFMNNHVHFIMEGPEGPCLLVFKKFKKKLNIYLSRTGRSNVLKNFDCGAPIAIETLDQMRTEICYVHRNMYVSRSDILPHTWAWGSGGLYFNPTYIPKQSVPINEVNIRDLRKNYFFGRITEIPEGYTCAKGYIQPESFVNYRRGESFFRHASHYLNLLMKDRESYSLIAGRLGDREVLNHEEIYSAAVALSHEKWGNSKPQTLAPEAKLQLARILHYDYKVGNAAISRVLKLDQSILNEIFPVRAQ